MEASLGHEICTYQYILFRATKICIFHPISTLKSSQGSAVCWGEVRAALLRALPGHPLRASGSGPLRTLALDSPRRQVMSKCVWGREDPLHRQARATMANLLCGPGQWRRTAKGSPACQCHPPWVPSGKERQAHAGLMAHEGSLCFLPRLRGKASVLRQTGAAHSSRCHSVNVQT